MQWVNCVRRSPPLLMWPGHAMTIGSRAPPRWLAICLPHWNGVFWACAQAAAKWGALWKPPRPSSPPNFSMSASCCSASSTSPLKNVVSLKDPVIVPSMDAPLSPQM